MRETQGRRRGITVVGMCKKGETEQKRDAKMKHFTSNRCNFPKCRLCFCPKYLIKPCSPLSLYYKKDEKAMTDFLLLISAV